MSEQKDAISEENASAELAPQQKDGGGFGAVSRKIRSRTTDLLAIGIVLIGGLTVGSRVHSWWATDDVSAELENEQSVAATGAMSAWGADNIPVLMDFGDSPHSVQRTFFSGTAEAASAALVGQCRAVVKTAVKPVVIAGGAAEKMLSELVRHQPVEELAGDWRVYRFNGPFLLVAGTRNFAAESGADSFRLACWGMAFASGASKKQSAGGKQSAGQKQGEKRWTLFIFQPRGESVVAGSSGLPVIALPANTKRLFSIRDEQGRSWLTFRGESVEAGEAAFASWRLFYTGWFRREGWEIDREWRFSGSQLSAVFRKETKFAEEIGVFVDRAELLFDDSSGGGLTATVIVTRFKKRSD